MSETTMNFEDSISHDIRLRYYYCICCLEQNGPFISIPKCVHSGFLETFPMPDFIPSIPKVICPKCHSTLKKINNFKRQAQESYNILSNKVPFRNKLDTEPKLTISKVKHLDISENECTIDNVDTKIILQTNTSNMTFKNTKNIETALNIINTNANSLQSLVSNNLKSITDTLLVVANEHLNLEPARNTVLPGKATSSTKLPNENYILMHSSKRKVLLSEIIGAVPEKRKNLNASVKIYDKSNSVYIEPDVVTDNIGVNGIDQLELKDELNTEYLNVNEDVNTNIKYEIMPFDKNYELDTDDKINTIDCSIKTKHNEDTISMNSTKIQKDTKTKSMDNNEVTTDIDQLNSEIVLPMDFKKESEEDVVIDFAYGTNVLRADLKEEPDDSGPDREKCLTRNDVSKGLTIDDSASITAQTLNHKQLQEERENKLKSKEYLKWPHRCDSCIIGFQFKENLDDHNKRKHEMRDGQVSCQICQQAVNVDSMEDHMFTHYNRLQCEECKKRFVLFDEAYYHYRTVHAKRKNKLNIKRKLSKNNDGIKKGNKNIKTVKKTKPSTAISSPEYKNVSSTDCAEFLTRDVINNIKKLD